MQVDLKLLGDPDADTVTRSSEWRRVFEHFTPRLDDYFLHRVPDSDERDDLLQHIWYKAVLHIGSLPSSDVLWNWLRRVGENRLIDLQRSAASGVARAEEHAAEVRHELSISDSPSALDVLASNPFDGVIGQKFAALSQEDRTIILLALDAVPHAEIARHVGLPSAAASRQRWSRLRRILSQG